MFRDQSKEVGCKVAMKSRNTFSHSIIHPNFVDQSRNLFFDRYVYGNSRTYDYVPTLISTNDEGSCLPAAIYAASLAYYSTQIVSSDVLNSAREKYARTLRLVSEALQSRDQALNDTTLASVLILDLFEKLARTRRSSESWTNTCMGLLRSSSSVAIPNFNIHLGYDCFFNSIRLF